MTDLLAPITAMPRASLALFLDFDGVLVDIAATPDAVRVESGLVDHLRAAERALDGALAIVSGRPLSEIDGFLESAVPTVFGSHGAESRVSGVLSGATGDMGETASRLALLAERLFADIPGVLVEPKPAGVAVHYRSAPDAEDIIREALTAEVDALDDFHLLSGKMVFEARPAGFDKGRAVATLMETAAFAGRTPVFIGDDVTDEDGMREAIARGGYGVRVGPGDSVAQIRLPDRSAVSALLERLASPAAHSSVRNEAPR